MPPLGLLTCIFALTILQSIAISHPKRSAAVRLHLVTINEEKALSFRYAALGQGAVVLGRAAKSLDLWSLIESAQYARIVFHERPADQTEAQAIASFTEALSTIVEAWSEVALRNAAPMLKDLDARLEDLARRGLFVHGGCVERSIRNPNMAPIALPIAIIRIGHDESDRISVEVPAELLVDLPADEEPSIR
jgi:hypothetical protein